MRILAQRSALVACLLLAHGTLHRDADAATRTWIGGDNDWNGSGLNWTGLDEPDPDDDAVFNTNNHVEMAIDNEVLSLDLSGGIELDTETFFLDVNGGITLSDSGTRLRVGESNLAGLPDTSVSAHSVTVGDGATYANANFTSIIDPSGIGLFSIEAGGALVGHELIRSGDGIVNPTVVISNDGVIRPGSVFDGIVIGGQAPAARTLTLAAIDGDARIDLDGVAGIGAVDVTRNQTLDIDIQLDDDFDGVIDLAHNSTLDIQDAWEFAGTMNVDNGFVAGNPPFIPNVPADVAFLTGGHITMNEATTTINVLDEDGTLQFDAQFTADDGTIANNGHVIFNQDATINAGVDFQMIGVEADMTVGPAATVVINDADMDFDGGGGSENVITVEAGGRLEFNLDSFEGNDRADGFLTLNSGSLDLTVTDGSWTMERRLTLNNSSGVNPVVTGSAMVVGDDAIQSQSNDADVLVEGAGVSQINVPVTWNSDAEVDVAAGATLAVLGFSTFNSVNGAENAQFDGPGDIFFSGGQVNEATTLNFSGGTVGLDSGGALVILLSAPDFTIDAPLTINAAQIDEYGRSVNFPNPDSSVLTVNAFVGGQLEVNLDDPAAAWTVNDDGLVRLVGSNIAFLTAIDGSDLNMNGEMNVDGLNRVDARMTIGATGEVVFNDAAANLRLRGGDLVSVNRLNGGDISGSGEISAPNGRALHGHGSINADLDFDGDTSEFLADDGTLTIDGAILDVGVIGTADSDGVLNVVGAWNTSAAAAVRLDGGQVIGGDITNDGAGGVRGSGLVSARVQNDTVIVADNGGTLVLDAPLNNNDWDGAGGTGSLRAQGGGLLELRDNADFNFNGEVVANNATVETVDFALDFSPTSTLALNNGGVFQSTEATDLGGAVNVSGAAAAAINAPGARFESTSVVTLNADLVLEGNSQVEAGAAFAGGGALINSAGRTLTLFDGADVDVLVQNEGRLALGASPGQTSGTDFEQTAAGVLEIELQGTGLNLFDRMALTGLAQLDGELEVSLIGGFTPLLGDTFTILTAASVAGAFDVEDFALAPLGAGLSWEVLYGATTVQLAVVDFLLGDMNDDGIVNTLDIDPFVLAVTDPAQYQLDFPGAPFPAVGDINMDGLVNTLDIDPFVALLTGPAAAAVPTPASLPLAALAGLFAAPRRRRHQ